MHAVADRGPAALPRLAPLADMRPCDRCGRADPRRMFALMTRWFGQRAGMPLDYGYFYLCPTCYETLIATPPAAPAGELPA